MNEQVEGAEQTDKYAGIDYSDPDWYLQMLIESVNGTDLKFPITLYVNGIVLTGNLVSGHLYFAGLAEQLTTFFGEDWEHTPATVKNLTFPGGRYLKDKESDDSPPAYFVHLEEAKVMSPGQQPMPTHTGTWWRGRVSEVSGFNLGTFAIGPAS
jgi:hypothetical protein